MTIAYVIRDRRSVGGIQRFASNFLLAALQLHHYPYVVECWYELWILWWCDLVIIAHVNLLPLAILVAPHIPIRLIIYGIESWKPLTFWQRLGLWRVHRVIAISQYTAERAKPFLGEKSYVVLPCSAS